jgi:heat shock protein HtpX
MGLASALTRMQKVRGGFFEHILFPGRREPEPSVLRTHPTTEERVRRLKQLTVTPWRHWHEGPAAPRLTRAASARGPRWRYLSGLWH